MGEAPDGARCLLLLERPGAGVPSTEQVLDALGGGWRVAVTRDGGEALRCFDVEPIDMAVYEVDARGDRALAFFGEVARRSPRTVRIVLAGRDVPRDIVGERALVHGIIPKAGTPEELRSALARAGAFRRALETPFVRAVMDTIGILPRLPESYRDLLSALAAQTISPQEAEAILLSQTIPGLERFGSHGRWNDRGDPRSLLIAAIAYSSFASVPATTIGLPSLWVHSWKVAVAAPAIMAMHSPDPVLQAHCFLAGLLHDAGEIVMAIHPSEHDYLQLISGASKGVSLYGLESQTFGTNHAEVGSYLLGSIPLPEPVLDAVAHHHEPQRSAFRPFSPAFALHIADAFLYAFGKPDQAPVGERLQMHYLEDLDLVRRVGDWHRAVRDALEAFPGSRQHA